MLRMYRVFGTRRTKLLLTATELPGLTCESQIMIHSFAMHWIFLNKSLNESIAIAIAISFSRTELDVKRLEVYEYA